MMPSALPSAMPTGSWLYSVNWPGTSYYFDPHNFLQNDLNSLAPDRWFANGVSTPASDDQEPVLLATHEMPLPLSALQRSDLQGPIRNSVLTQRVFTAKAAVLALLRPQVLAFDAKLAAKTEKNGDTKHACLKNGTTLTRERVIEEFRKLYPGEAYEIAGDLQNPELGFAVFNAQTLHAVLVRAGKFIPVEPEIIDDRYVNFTFGTVPGTQKLQTHRTERHNARQESLLQRVAKFLGASGMTLGGQHAMDRLSARDKTILGGAFYLGIEIEGGAVDPQTGRSVDLSTSKSARHHLIELGGDMLETDTNTVSVPRQVLRALVTAQEKMTTVVRNYWEERVDQLGFEAAGPRPVVLNTSVPMNNPVNLNLTNNMVGGEGYGGYVASFEQLNRAKIDFRGPFSRVVAKQVAKKEGFESVDHMLRVIKETSCGSWWDPRAAQYNVGLPNLWTEETGWWNRVLSYFGSHRGRFTVSAKVQKDMANILFGRWVIGLTQMVNASSPWFHGIVPDLGNGLHSRDMRALIANDMDTAWGMSRALRDESDLVMTGTRNIVMAFVDRVERSRLPHEIPGASVEFPDGKGTRIPGAKASVHGGGRSRDEVSGLMRNYGTGLWGWLKFRVFGPHFEGGEGAFDKLRGRHEVTRPANSDALAVASSGIFTQLLAMQAVLDSAEGKDPVREFAKRAKMPNAETASPDDLVVGGDEVALDYFVRGAADPRVRTYLNQLENLVRAINIPVAQEQKNIALGLIAAMKEPSRGLADYALHMRGSLGDALLWEYEQGHITTAAEAVRVVAAFQEMQRQFISTRNDDKLDCYLQRKPGAGFVFSVEANLNFGLGSDTPSEQPPRDEVDEIVPMPILENNREQPTA